MGGLACQAGQYPPIDFQGSKGERMSELQIEGQELKVGKAVAWELTAEELIYPRTIQVGSKSTPLFVHMKPYRADDLKKMLDEVNTGVKVQDDENKELISNKIKVYPKFFWQHFLRLSGHGKQAEPGDIDIEKQKQWIRDNPRLDIPYEVVEEGFGGIALKRVGDDDDESTNSNHLVDEESANLLEMDLNVTTCVELTQKICLPEFGLVEIQMDHNFHRETASEYQRFKHNTNKQVLHNKRQAVFYVTNHGVIENLYNSLIESVEGMTLKGEPCVTANKDKWVELVPYWHKQLSLMKFFSGIQSKNG